MDRDLQFLARLALRHTDAIVLDRAPSHFSDIGGSLAGIQEQVERGSLDRTKLPTLLVDSYFLIGPGVQSTELDFFEAFSRIIVTLLESYCKIEQDAT